MELTVGEIAERCALKPSTASEHLSLLRRGGLVLSRKEDKRVFYRGDGATTAERLGALQQYLARCCPPGCA
ncbi:ArsR/SmtB family transcription factor [Streptomyces rishiriensis]|uniref:DNA-binding transcriptional ArsR family regulator n=1 Tax=Streptomyces rishiriensis TaxID=68264 RepID=A0ABU0NH62_STRRH|nr:helix-turn-helix domain-containing protein [Streptomyces rishiriensis]MDQ0578433.1 DNA-binding transcriptional ArsR family regulator [Streptomyces rishiriensis]